MTTQDFKIYLEKGWKFVVPMKYYKWIDIYGENKNLYDLCCIPPQTMVDNVYPIDKVKIDTKKYIIQLYNLELKVIHNFTIDDVLLSSVWDATRLTIIKRIHFAHNSPVVNVPVVQSTQITPVVQNTQNTQPKQYVNYYNHNIQPDKVRFLENCNFLNTFEYNFMKSIVSAGKKLSPKQKNVYDRLYPKFNKEIQTHLDKIITV